MTAPAGDQGTTTKEKTRNGEHRRTRRAVSMDVSSLRDCAINSTPTVARAL